MIIINGFRNKSGGGKVLYDDLFKNLKDNKDFYFIGPSDKWIFRIPLIVELFYDLIFKFSKDTVILTLGDIPVLTKNKQIYYFDWMFLCLSGREILKYGVKRVLKWKLIRIFSLSVNSVIVQTSTTKNKLERLNIFKKIIVGYVPTFDTLKISTDSKKKVFIYPANFSKHKRFDRIVEFSTKNLETKVVLTIDSQDFYFLNQSYEVPENVVNIGPQNHEFIMMFLQNICDGVIFPSELESYGIPIFEAASFGKTILYWGQDFVDELVVNAININEYDPNNLKSSKLREKSSDFDIKEFQKEIFESLH